MSTTMTEALDVEALALEMKQAQDHAAQIPTFTSRVSGFGVAAAYEVSRALHRRRLAEGAKPLGRKIGFTNATVQQRYGVHQPMWAHVYDTTLQRAPGGRVASGVARFAQPKIEPEVMLHFAHAPRADADAAAILACLDWVAHGFEIVQSNFPDWRFEAADSIADSGLHAALFVGPPVPIERLGRDAAHVLESFTLELLCNGRQVDAGRGSNVLGSPLLAAAHLVATLAAQPGSEPLGAGEIVTTGTITDAHAVAAGQTWETRLAGIDLPGFAIEFR
jgi:2-keto-4-pentenoate hydratase